MVTNNESTQEVGVRPLPQVVTSYRDDTNGIKPWSVVPTVGEFGVGVDFAAGVLSIPMTDDQYSQRIQLEQLVRARISPMDNEFYNKVAKAHRRKHITPGLLQLCEIARVKSVANVFAAQRGLVYEPDGSEKTRGKQLATANTTSAWNKAVEFTVLYAGTKSFDQFAAGVRSVNSDWSKRLRTLNKKLEKVFQGHPSDIGDTQPYAFGEDAVGPKGFSNTLWAASFVEDYFSGESYSPNDIKDKSKTEDDAKASNYGKPDKLQPVNERGSMPVPSAEDMEDFPADYTCEIDEDPTGSDKFGKLIIDDTLSLTVEVEGYMRRKRRPMTSGLKLSYPSRMITDPERRVFGRKVKVKGGVVVIDISGSMQLSQSDLEAIVAAAPAALVLAYSDTDKGQGEPNAWILANRGWRVREIPYIGRANNGVDGPALTWAVRHRKSGEDIIWISDGRVTGLHGGINNACVVECGKLVKKHRIIMIPSVQEAVQMFKTNRIMNKPAGPIRDYILAPHTYV